MCSFGDQKAIQEGSSKCVAPRAAPPAPAPPLISTVAQMDSSMRTQTLMWFYKGLHAECLFPRAALLGGGKHGRVGPNEKSFGHWGMTLKEFVRPQFPSLLFFGHKTSSFPASQAPCSTVLTTRNGVN